MGEAITRHSLRPLYFGGGLTQQLGHSVPRERELMFPRSSSRASEVRTGNNNHRRKFFERAGALIARHDESRWLWIPAFAGMTNGPDDGRAGAIRGKPIRSPFLTIFWHCG